MKIKASSVTLTLVFGLYFISVPVLASGFPLSISDNSIQKGLDYLESIQQPEGSVGTYSDTGWVVMALAAAGKNPASWGNGKIMDYLKSDVGQLNESYNLPADLARDILAIIAAGQDPRNFGTGNAVVPSGDYVSALVDTFDGNQFGITDSLNEDCWAVIALTSAGYSADDSLIQTTLSYIKANQGEDQGWSWATPMNDYYFASDADNTAAAILALANAGEDVDSQYMTSALEYLRGVQMQSGGFSAYGVENTGSTAWSLACLNAVGEDISNWAKSGGGPSDFLISMQSSDGSFAFAIPLPEGYMPMSEKMTADCIIALTGNTYPVRLPVQTSVWIWVAVAAGIGLLAGIVIIRFVRR